MDVADSRLRIFTKRNPYFQEDPQIVTFQLDVAAMRFKEIEGSPVELTGFATDDWLADGFWPGRIHPDDRDAALGFCQQCAEQRRDHELEYRIVHKDGRTVWVHEIVCFNDNLRENSLAVGYIMNITPRVLQERDVAKVMDLKDELFRVVLEDLTQPVNKISNFGAMLERHLASQGDDVGSDYAVALREGLQQLGGLIAGLQSVGQDTKIDFDELSNRLAGLRSQSSLSKPPPTTNDV